MRPIFILGGERSGSTWLANIFDAHPDVELIMEPFADYANLIPQPWSRYEYVSSIPSGWGTALDHAYQELPEKKYPLLYRPGRPPVMMAVDRCIIRSYQAVRRLFRMAPSRLALWYDLLNLNRRELPVSRLTTKNPRPSVSVTKELRLNFKVPLLASAFPDGFYLVAIREPGAQIDSIEKLSRRGNLEELSSSLGYFKEALQQQERFRKYLALMDEVTETELLPLWWLVNYQTLLEDLKDYGMEHEVIRHEAIAADPAGLIAGILPRCGLSNDDAVFRYVEWSSRNQRIAPRPTDTTRDSREFYKRGISGVRPQLRERIGSLFVKAIECVQLDDLLRHYAETYSRVPGKVGSRASAVERPIDR